MKIIKSAKLVNLYFALNLSTGGHEYALTIEDDDVNNTRVLATQKTKDGITEIVETDQFGYAYRRINLLALLANNGNNFTQEEYDSLVDMEATPKVMSDWINRLQTDNNFQHNIALCCSVDSVDNPNSFAAKITIQRQVLLPVLQQYIRYGKYVNAKLNSHTNPNLPNLQTTKE